ncbi:hypothetical protein BH23THE1_BH23THE1_02900 [soil metagenome]
MVEVKPVRGHDEAIEKMILGLGNIYHVKQDGYNLPCQILSYYRLYFFLIIIEQDTKEKARTVLIDTIPHT